MCLVQVCHYARLQVSVWGKTQQPQPTPQAIKHFELLFNSTEVKPEVSDQKANTDYKLDKI